LRTIARSWPIAMTAFAALASCGCAHAPAFDVMGSLFPAWIICIALGIVFAAVTRWLIVRARINLLFPLLVYPCLAAAFTFAIWLIFF
jgi:hypothetical protein